MFETVAKIAGTFDVCVGFCLFTMAAAFAFGAAQRRWPESRWPKYACALFAGALIGISAGIMRSLISWIWSL
jgi:hypothetical protein